MMPSFSIYALSLFLYLITIIMLVSLGVNVLSLIHSLHDLLFYPDSIEYLTNMSGLPVVASQDFMAALRFIP
jgi:hypothetical protein